MPLDTTALAALTELEVALKVVEAKAVAALPAADLSLLQAFVADFAAQVNGDPNAAQKLRDDAKKAITTAGHWLGTALKDLGGALDPTVSTTQPAPHAANSATLVGAAGQTS